MKVLLVSEYYPPTVMGGGEINLALIAQGLTQQGIEVIVLTSRQKRLPRVEEKEGIRILRILKTGTSPQGILNNLMRSTFFPLSLTTEIKNLAKKEHFDLIHFFGISIIAAPKVKELGIPLFATIESYPTLCPKGDRMYHGKEECRIRCSYREFTPCLRDSPEIGKMNNRWYFKYNPPFWRYNYAFYEKLNTSLQHCHLIAISQYVQELLEHQGYLSTVIPNIIEMERFQNNISSPSDSGKKRILYLGSLTRYKGPQVLVEALKGLDCRCDFYGDGPLKKELEEKIKEYHLDAEIHPPIPYEKVPELYAQCDIVVFPSLWPEPFGRIVVEAEATGKVIVASNIGGITETSCSRKILTPPGDASVLRENIKKVLVRINNDSKTVNQKTEGDCSVERVGMRYEQIYQEVIP